LYSELLFSPLSLKGGRIIIGDSGGAAVVFPLSNAD